MLDLLLHRFNEHGIGFTFDEVMSGEHEFEPGCGPQGAFPFEFRVTWGSRELGTWIDPRDPNFMHNKMWGTVTVGGLCDDTTIQEGYVDLKYFHGSKIQYGFDFTVNGLDYHCVAEKRHIKLWNLPYSHTTCYGVLTEKESGKLISRSLTHFYFHRLPSFLFSFRIVK